MTVESRPEYQVEVTDSNEPPFIKMSPVAWFERLVAEYIEFFDEIQANPAKFEYHVTDSEGIQAERQQAINEVGAAFHKIVESWHTLAVLTQTFESGYDNEETRQILGQLRQAMIKQKVRPKLGYVFISDYDLTQDAQRLFSLLGNDPMKRQDLLTFSTAENQGFDLVVAMTELRIWEFLDESDPDYLRLANNPDLSKSF